MKTYRIAVIAGDGIGKEVIPAGIDVMKMAAAQGKLPLRVHRSFRGVAISTCRPAG